MAKLATRLHALEASGPAIQRLAHDYERLASAYRAADAVPARHPGPAPPALNAALERTSVDALRARVPSCAPPWSTPTQPNEPEVRRALIGIAGIVLGPLAVIAGVMPVPALADGP